MSKVIEIDTREARTPDSFSIEWFSITNLKDFKTVIRQESHAVNDKRVYLFGKNDDCLRNGAQIFVYLFNLPDEQKQFGQQLLFYKDQQKGYLLTDKRKFDKSILHLPHISDSFSHEAFQTRDGKYRKRIVHIYQDEQRACMVIYSLDDIVFEENSFFNTFAKNAILSLHEPC